MKIFTSIFIFLLAVPGLSLPIFVRGLDGKTMILDVQLHDSVWSVKQKIEEKTQIACELQRLVYGGKQLIDEYDLKKYNIDNASTLHLYLSLKAAGFIRANS